jgi:nickel/cobalt exporter
VKRLVVVLVAAASLAVPTSALAHPLGNFTVNRAAEITASGDRIYVRAVLDLAEIPTFQEGDRVRRPDFAAELAAKLVLSVDGRQAHLRPLVHRIDERPGAGGLPTLRFEAVYAAARSGRVLAFRDLSFPERIGWREIVVRAERGARLESSTAPRTSPSRLLTEYPKDRLQSPLDLQGAQALVRPGKAPGAPPGLTATAPPAKEGALGRLVSGELGIGFVLLSLALALFWGAAHALEPGHGKAIVAGYLVGARGTPRHAVLLGLIVTATHTAGVFALGLTTLALSEFIVPEQLYPWLNLVAALLVVGVGVGVLRSRLGSWLHARAHARGTQHHHHDHDHRPGLRSLVGAGVSGGIIPCPTALVVLLAALSLHRVAYGLVLVLAFSVGLAATVTGIGMLAVGARRVFVRASFDGPLVRALPAASAAVVFALGLVMTARAVPPLL